MSLTAGFSPPRWFIVFRRTTTLKAADWLAFGRYKHVSCFGPVPGAGAWVFFDFGARNAAVAVVPDGQADSLIGDMTDGALVVEWIPSLRPPPWRFRPAFLCTSAVAHLTGVPSSALRPDRLLADCLAAGAEIVVTDEPRKEQARARPAT